MKSTKLTPPPCLSASIVLDSYAGSAQRRNHHADRLGSFPLLSGTGTQRGDARLDDQTWRTCLRWCQHLRQWYARHFSAGSQRVIPWSLGDQWDALHERGLIPTTEGLLDSIARTHPSLRIVIYTSLI